MRVALCALDMRARVVRALKRWKLASRGAAGAGFRVARPNAGGRGAPFVGQRPVPQLLSPLRYVRRVTKGNF